MKTIVIQYLEYTLIIPVILCVFTLSVSCKQPARYSENNAMQDDNTGGNDTLMIEQPVSYKNLQIFPVIGKSNNGNAQYMTLAEAINKKHVVINETGSVNQLTADNSSNYYIFIHAGDIVKGGRQDRTMGTDIIIGPKEKNVSLESYCVESGRWQQREGEASGHFSDNTKVLSSRDQKVASAYKKDQSAVWQSVSEQQEKLNKNLSQMKGENVNVRSDVSSSSLQLALESEDLQDIVKEYKDNLPVWNSMSENAVGFAYAINGEIYGIEIYNDAALFKAMKDKLLESAIVEAISEYEKDKQYSAIERKTVVNELSKMENSKADKTTEVNEQTENAVTTKDKTVMMETRQKGDSKGWVHRRYITGVEEKQQPSYDQNSYDENINQQRIQDQR